MATAAPNHLHAQFPLLFQQNEVVNPTKVQSLYARFNQLRTTPQADPSAPSPEFIQLSRFFDFLKKQNSRPPQPPPSLHSQPQPHLNGLAPSAEHNKPLVDPSSTPTIQSTLPTPLPPLSPDIPPEPITFSENQLDALRAQIQAFKYLSRGLPVPQNVRDAVNPAEKSASDLKKEVDGVGKSVVAKVVDSAVNVHQAAVNGTDDKDKENEKESGPKFTHPTTNGKPLLENDPSSKIFPYNAFVHPMDMLKPKPHPSKVLSHKQQTMLVPSLMPAGLDPYHLLAERNRYIDARITHRIKELSELPSSIGDGSLEPPYQVGDEDDENVNGRYTHPGVNAHGKLRALIELKGLQLRDKQRALRLAIVQRLGEASSLTADRKDFKRYRKQTVRDARMTESIERKQRQEREERAKQKHIDYLRTICNHGQAMITSHRVAQSRVNKLAKAVLKYHVDTEKEEQKRIERISKERLKALKADDEEAYLKLIDTAKDTRITHLLKQTDSYLDSLAQAVQAQQAEEAARHGKPAQLQHTDESTFGASRMEDEDTVSGEKTKVDYYSIAHRISERVTAQPGILVGGTLKEYQLKGLQWMVSLYNNNLNGILADEMGLGKTIQTISLITFLIERKRQPGPYLVIVPLSTLPNWTLEFEKWAPAVRHVVYKGSPSARKALQMQLRAQPFQVMLTTFEYIIKDRPFLSKYKWLHTIIDEGHRMKNTQSKLSQTLTQYYSTRYRLILTGTPLQNNLPELWALLNFVLPKVFNSVKSFDEWFNTPFANTGAQDNIQLNEEESLLVIRRLHKVLRPFLLRRLKKDVESELPDKVEKVIKCKMSALQSQLYKYMREHKMFPQDKADQNGKVQPVKGLQNMVMQMRKICQHPFVFPQVEDAVNPTKVLNSTVIRTAGKVTLLDRMLPKLFRTGHRVLIFFQMTNVMDILEDYMNYRGYLFLRLDGGTKTEDRGSLLKQFNEPNSPYNVFMLSTRAGGLGLNLQTADTVIIYDSDWNPHADLQAQDRAHRIGQKKAVRIFRFVTEKSVEEAILTAAKFKLDMDEKVIQAGRFDNKSTAEERDDYLRQLIEDQDDESNEQTGDIGDDELNELLARSDEEQVIFRQMDIERDAQERQEWISSGGVGPMPDRLMQLHEVPLVYQQENPFPKKDYEDLPEGRGARIRKDVRYNDGLTDEQWTNALEDDTIDMDDYIEKRQQAREKRNAKKSGKAFASGQSTPVPELEPKKRGRGRGKGRTDEDSPAPTGKRKRMVKEMSLTPSANEDDEDDRPSRDSKRRKTQAPLSGSGGPTDVRERMKRVFGECHKAVMTCTDDNGRKRCELFKELPSKKEYSDYYEIIREPISISMIRKRSSGPYYKTVDAYAKEWRRLFDNARQYNQEGSWVYNDANEMQKAFEATFKRLTAGTDLPGAQPGSDEGGSGGASADDGKSTMLSDEEDDEPVRRPPVRNRRVKDDSADEYEDSD
ncbi:hypothetical protein FRC03_011386 [Tulasnella sp. 419]|nr:hypothetical protein FRC03_011386 [Tulasnella sp. 419]